ncbi:N-acetylneuraminate synthase [Candidatus Woesearchaeota archaeon]|nr:N-acetylneuraminate synthase [Candidatus Woesearchaeota archaeon]
MKTKKEYSLLDIGGKRVGPGQPCFIIAEAGVNHNGDINLAKKLVDAAVEAGADCVKFQTFKSENLVTKAADMAEYQEKNLGEKDSQFSMLKKLELKLEDFKTLKEYCDRKGIIFMSTPHTQDTCEYLNPLMPAFKLGSPDLNNIPYLKRIAKFNKPIVLATGMGTMEEVKEAEQTIFNEGNNKLILLHCTTNYPCPRNEVNLRAMKTMMDQVKSLVGYSDHTEGIDVCVMAVKLGAFMIEKHFTLDKNMPGPDHKASNNPAELKQLIAAVRRIESDRKALAEFPMDETVLGSPEKKPNKSEVEMMKVVRKSIASAKKIPKGTEIQEDMLVIKRPSSGIAPKELEKLVGKRAAQDIPSDIPVTWDMVEM